MNAIGTITVDCADPAAVAPFWEGVLGWTAEYYDDDGPVAYLANPGEGPSLLFQRVPEPKTVKNRVHLDLRPTDRTRDEEVSRLVAAGATVVGDYRRPDGKGWVVLADPEGNELCIERSDAERTADA